jgi:uncharacterized membrane protein
MMESIFLIILLTMIPLLELRASIPAGILGLSVTIPFTSFIVTLDPTPWAIVLIVAIIANWILGLLLYFFMDFILKVLTIVPAINRLKEKLLVRTQRRIHPYVEKYGLFGVALFIGVPLPGSGVYTGALGAYLMGMEKKTFAKASFIGVVIAGIAVTAITLVAQRALA